MGLCGGRDGRSFTIHCSSCRVLRSHSAHRLCAYTTQLPFTSLQCLFDNYIIIQAVSQILVRGGRAVGVQLEDGSEVMASALLSNATPKVTFLDLLEKV